MNRQKSTNGAVFFSAPPEFKLLKEYKQRIRQLEQRLSHIEYVLNQLLNRVQTLEDFSDIPTSMLSSTSKNNNTNQKEINKQEN